MGSASAQATKQSAVYAGEISPQDAWEQLKHNPKAVLIDVRTPQEWTSTGTPDLNSIGKKLHKISWSIFPSRAAYEKFAATVRDEGVATDAPVFIICRSGARSYDAAVMLTAEGFTECYNVTDGFEGPPNEAHQRGTLAGWKASNLPWGHA